jgi:CheY-like chemotaxis protein
VPRVLVLDDHPHVRATVTLALRVKGFDVVSVESGALALAQFEQSEFDLAIVDIFMPGMDGTMVIRKLRERAPRLPVVAISGMTALDFFSAFPELSDVVCLQKPFRPNELLTAIQSAVDAVQQTVCSPC